MKKRFLAILLVICLCVSLAPAVSAEGSSIDISGGLVGSEGGTGAGVVSETYAEQLDVASASIYNLTGVYNTATGEYTVDVYIISTEHVLSGAFGLDYDEHIFKLKEFTFGDNIECADPDNVRDFGLDSFTRDHSREGYHTFFWMKQGGKELNTSAPTGAKIASYVFTTTLSKSGDLSGIIDNQSFRAKDFSQTDVYDALMENTVGQELIEEYWNNGEDGNSYYQICCSNPDSTSVLDKMIYKPAEVSITHAEQSYSRVNFQVYEGTPDSSGSIIPDENGQKIQNAVISIYDAAGELVGTTTTDADGSARASLQANQNYTYIVKNNKYWPAPGGEQNPERYGVIKTAQLSNAETLTVGMLKKQGYDVEWNLTLGKINGEKFKTDTGAGIQDVDYPFIVEPDPGVWIQNGTQPTYTVTDPKTGAVVTSNGKQLKDQPAVWDYAINKWVVPGADILGKVTLNVEFMSQTYKIMGIIGSHGKIQYTGTPSSGTIELDGGSGIITHQGIAAGDASVVFQFKPDTGYVIDWVAINGSLLPVEDTRGKTAYSYQFENVEADGEIVVTFAKIDPTDPDHPISQDGILTVISGISGKIELTMPGAQAETINGGGRVVRPVSIGSTVKAEVKADQGVANRDETIDFMIDALYVDETKQTDATGANHTVELTVTGNHSISSTFKDSREGAASLQYHVFTGISEGKGSITPFGVHLYDAGSNITVKAAADENLQITSAQVNGETVPVNAVEYDYPIRGLDQDYKIYITCKAASITGTARTDAGKGTITLNLYKGNAATDMKNPGTPVATATAESDQPFAVYLDAPLDGEHFLIATCPGFTSCYVYGINGSVEISEILELYGGDFNHDGFINDDDYLMFMAEYAKGTTAAAFADINKDGVVNDDDYLLYMANYADINKRQNKVINLTTNVT